MKKIVNLEVVTTRGWKKKVNLEVVTTRGWKKIVNLEVVTTRRWKKIVNLEVVTTRIWKKRVKVVNFVVVEGLKSLAIMVTVKKHGNNFWALYFLKTTYKKLRVLSLYQKLRKASLWDWFTPHSDLKPNYICGQQLGTAI
jgi:hypothetical protein